MDEANNPVEGTGLTVDQTANKIFSMMDSDDATTQNVDADDDDTILSSNDDNEEEIELSEAEKSETDSESDTEEVEPVEQDKDKREPTSSDDDTLVDVHGEKVKLKELKDGYLRRADYTKKTQELSEHKARYQVQEKGMDEVRAEALKEIQNFKTLLAGTLDLNEPNWDELAQYDQGLYIQKRHEWEKKESMVRGLYEREQQIIQKQKETQTREFAEKQTKEWETLTGIFPEFADAGKGHALLTEIGKLLLDEGFTPEEVEGIADHRVMKIAYAALKARIASSKVEKVVKQTMAETIKPVTSSKPDLKTNNKSKELEKLRRSGTTGGVAAWIEKSFN